MDMKKRKLLIVIPLAVLAVMAMIVTAVALFSDYVAKREGGTAGMVKVVQEGLEIQTKQGKQEFSETLNNWNPGDVNRLRWRVENKGSKSVDTRNIVWLYWDVETDIHEYYVNTTPGTMYLYPAFSAVDGTELSDAAIRANILAGANGALCKVDTTVLDLGGGVTRVGYRYEFDGDVLSGVGLGAENDAADHSESGLPMANDSENAADVLELKIAFDPRTNITMMDVPFKVQVITQAKQHRNSTDNDWTVFS